MSWPAYTNLSPPTPVIADLWTVNCGKFSVFTFTFDLASAIFIGVHQSQYALDTNLSCSSTLSITVSPTSFTSVSVVTPAFPAALSTAVSSSAVSLFAFSLSTVASLFSASLFSSPSVFPSVIPSSPSLPGSVTGFSSVPSVWVPSVWVPSAASVVPLVYKKTPTDIPAANNNTITVISAIIRFLLIIYSP